LRVRKAAKARKINAIGDERPAAELGAVVADAVPAEDELVFEEVDLVVEAVVLLLVAALNADDVELLVMEERAEEAEDTRDDSEEAAADEALATPPLRVN